MKYKVEIEWLPDDYIHKRINFINEYNGSFCRNIILDNVCDLKQ